MGFMTGNCTFQTIFNVILFIVLNLRCFFRGNGGTVNVLRISGPQGYPECGTQRVCQIMMNELT